MAKDLIVVDGYVWAEDVEFDMRGDDAWSIALDQRAFGPRRLLVVTATADGQALALSHARRTDRPEVALDCCLDHAISQTTPHRPVAAVAYCDELVSDGPLPPTAAQRFERARAVSATHGIHLVDWFMCDDQMFRSVRCSIEDVEEWWDVPNN